MQPLPDRNFDALVTPTKLHRSLYTDPAIFELEMARIWGQAWIYIGHESQVPNPGDYFTTHINHDIPVVMIRDKESNVHVLHNRCGHKGAKVVETPSGNVRGALRCPYHGWTYRFDGSLLKIPNEKGYEGTGFDASDPCYSMQSVAQVESYRGFVFATLSASAPDLVTWMGGAKACFDNLCDRAPEGEVEVAGGVLRYEHDCNWKFILENLNDTMHPMVGFRGSNLCTRIILHDDFSWSISFLCYSKSFSSWLVYCIIQNNGRNYRLPIFRMCIRFNYSRFFSIEI